MKIKITDMRGIRIKVGDLVRNTRTGEIGIVLLKRIDGSFLKVLNGKIDEWFGSNLERVIDENRSDERPSGDIPRDMV
jgi:hypothetical protein